MAEHRTKVGGRLTAAMRRDLTAVQDGTAVEAQFQRVVVAYAKEHGWLVHHTPKARIRGEKFVTPTVGHVGFPDLTMTRGGRLLFVELKAGAGSQTDMQSVWMNRLEEVPGIEYHLWWPRHWRTAMATLRS